jgi:hypothetical protein
MTRRMHTTVKVIVSIHLTVLVVVGCRPERSSQHAVSSKAKQTHDVAVTSVSVPSMCVQGDIVPVTVTVENQGNSSPRRAQPLLPQGQACPRERGERVLVLRSASQSSNCASLVLRSSSSFVVSCFVAYFAE